MSLIEQLISGLIFIIVGIVLLGPGIFIGMMLYRIWDMRKSQKNILSRCIKADKDIFPEVNIALETAC